MPDDSRIDNIEKLLSDEKAIEERRRALIAELLKQREAAMKAFDEKLAKLGYQANSSGRTRRSHHKKATVVAAEKPKTETPARPKS